MSKINIADAFAGYPEVPELPEGTEQFVRNVVLPHSKYMFCKREKGIRWGYCTHCDATVQLTGTKRIMTADEWDNGNTPHNGCGVCPECKHPVTFKNAGLGRSMLVDRGNIIVAIVQGNALWLRFFEVYRDYRVEYRFVKTRYEEKNRAHMNPNTNKTAMWRWEWYSKTWYKMARVGTGLTYAELFAYPRNFEGTKFQYCQLDEYIRRRNDNNKSVNIVKYLDIFARYPSIEYLIKGGFADLADQLAAGKGCKWVNWRGKSPEKVLKMCRKDIKIFRDIGGKWEQLAAYRLLRTTIRDITVKEYAEHFANISLWIVKTNLMPIFEVAPWKKAMEYIKKQADGRRNQSTIYANSDYRDYLKQCQDLGIDLSLNCNLFPRSLKKAHERTNAIIQAQHDAIRNARSEAERLSDIELSKKIKARYDKLCKSWGFEHNGLFIRPAKSVNELVREGKSLSHCVGTFKQYRTNHAAGLAYIFFIRESKAPKTPYYTIEITKAGSVMQVRGKYNAGATAEVNAFLEEFKAVKIYKTKQTAESQKSA